VGMPAQKIQVTTIDELLALPADGKRHELLAGVHVMTPSPAYAHQLVVQAILVNLCRVVEGREDLKILHSPADIVLAPDTLVQPDVFAFEIQPGVVIKDWAGVGIPALAVEVLSPSTARYDRGVKRRVYQSAGVREYWIVDIDARLIERWRPSDIRPEIIAGRFEWDLHDGETVSLNCLDFFSDIPKDQ
jgi:Uma2 family endonuclease